MSKKSLILMPILITLLLAPIASGNSAVFNGMEVTMYSWFPTGFGSRITVPFKIKNISGVQKNDVCMFFTGQVASPWGQLYYVGNGKWEKTSNFTGTKLRASMGYPKAAMPIGTGQEIIVAPGEPHNAEYPYLSIGTLAPDQEKELEYTVQYVELGGSGNFYPPYQQFLCVVEGKENVPNKNRPPTAYDTTVTTTVDTPVQITLYATDPDGDDLLYEIGTSSANNGTLTGIPPNMTYTPAPGFIGADYFYFMALDKKTASNVATVTIYVDQTGSGGAPVANDDAYSTNVDTEVNVAEPGVLANDSDVDGDPLAAVLVTGPSSGSLTLNADGSFSYNPNTNFNGTDTFTYKANDGALDSNIATVTIYVGQTGSPSGFQGLGDLPGGGVSSKAYGISADASVVVGVSSSASGAEEAFRWTSGGGIEGLGDLPGGDFLSRAYGASADGSVIVGFATSDIGTGEAFRWTSSGMEGLGHVSDPAVNSLAYSVSSDGSVVVGGSRTYTGGWAPFRAFRWEGGIMTAYPPISGFNESLADDVSSDGQIMVGGST